MDINSISPASGRIIAEDGSTKNIVDLLGGGSPVSGETYDIDSYSPRTGRVIGEDGKIYNLVDLLGNGGNNGGAGTPGRVIAETFKMEATGDKTITIFAGSTVIKNNGEIFVFENDTEIGAANIDIEDNFNMGQDYYVHINDTGDIIISIASAIPASRNIGGFHYGVCRIDALSPLNVYDGILSRSVWTPTNRPKCAPQGMVYLSDGVWVDIYLSSDDGAGGLASKFYAVPMTGTENLTWYAAMERLFKVGKRMLSYREWVQAAMGSPPGAGSGNQNAWTTASERAPCGFVRNAVSTVGCRDCVGNVWEWLSDIIASGIGENPDWFDPMSGQGQGQMWLNANNDFRALLAGGSYFNGALVGARSVCSLFSPWNDNPSFGVRGACDSL